MIENDFIVPPRRWDEIGDIADIFRSKLGLADVPKVPVIEVLEQVLDNGLNLVRLEISTAAEMKGAEGYTSPDGKSIMLRGDVYESACMGDGRARFTVGHEIGHWALHTNIPLCRAKHGESLPPYRLAEPQANQFAAEFLMPVRFMTSQDDVDLVMKRHGVSREAAANRLHQLKKRGKL